MHINKTKKIATLGIMAALSTVFCVLGTVISVNTVFFTAAASFLVGLAVVVYGKGYGTGFFLVCTTLDILLNPNKLHVFLYLALGGYVLLSEITYSLMSRKKQVKWAHMVVRFLAFAVIYTPVILFIPGLIFTDTVLQSPWYLAVVIMGGIGGWFIFDLAYTFAKRWLYQRVGKLFHI